MAQTTTAINSCNAVIEIDNAAGTPVDVSGSSNNAKLMLSKELGEGHSFQGAWAFVLECKKKGSLDLSAIYSRDGTEARALLEAWFESGGNRTVAIYPEGKINGARSYTGEYKIGDIDLDLKATEAGPIVLNAKLMPDGEIAFSNYAT